jgi:hypothetical protein
MEHLNRLPPHPVRLVRFLEQVLDEDGLQEASAEGEQDVEHGGHVHPLEAVLGHASVVAFILFCRLCVSIKSFSILANFSLISSKYCFSLISKSTGDKSTDSSSSV